MTIAAKLYFGSVACIHELKCTQTETGYRNRGVGGGGGGFRLKPHIEVRFK